MAFSSDTYARLEQRFADWSSIQPVIAAVIVVDSRARSDHPADEWSDLDLVVFASDTALYLHDSAWLSMFGRLTTAISNSFGQSDREWIALYEDGSKLDVAFLSIDPATAPTLQAMLDVFPYPNVLMRGVRVLHDKTGTLQRNFQGYSTRGGADIYAFGMSSISQTEDYYWQNHKDLPEYYGSLDQGKIPLHKTYSMTPEDKIRRTTIMRLMCDLGLDYEAMSRLLGLNFKDHFAPEIESLDDMEADGLLVKTPGGILITDLGRLLVRNIAMRFDAYASTRKENRFSRTI